MPFSWYHPDIPEAFKVTGSKASRMYNIELQERAALLMRLGFSLEETTRRLHGNVRWDFELHEDPAHLAQVKDLVEKVYKTRRDGAGGPPSLEG
jgi:hypothetical protein